MIFYAFDQNHVFAFHSKEARDAYCSKVDMHVKPCTSRQRYQLCTRGQTAYFLYNEHCGRYSVIGINPIPTRSKKGRR